MKFLGVKVIASILLMFACFIPVQAYAAQIEETESMPSIPKLSTLKQISTNQLQISYDLPVDLTKGTDPRNYWIQSTAEQTPTNIATLGMNDSVNKSNSLTADKVKIQAIGNQGQTFVLTFSQNIAKGMAFKMIICYVTQPGQPPYTGDNGSASFIGQ